MYASKHPCALSFPAESLLCFLSWRGGNKGLLWCAQTLKGGSFSCLVAQPTSHRHREGDAVLLDRGQWILQSSFWQVSFCLWKTPSAGLQAVMSKDRLAPTAKQCPCQSADSWRASAASPKRANILKLKPVLPKAATQSLRCSRLLPWGSHLSELALEPKGSCNFACHSQLTCKGVAAALEVPGCRSLKNITDLSGLARYVGVVGNAGVTNTVLMPCEVHQQSRHRGKDRIQVKDSDQDLSETGMQVRESR